MKALKETRGANGNMKKKYLNQALERTKFPSTEQKKTPEFIISSWHLTVTAAPSSYSERVVFYS